MNVWKLYYYHYYQEMKNGVSNDHFTSCPDVFCVVQVSESTNDAEELRLNQIRINYTETGWMNVRNRLSNSNLL